jgi:hypothetical protein
VCPGALQAGRGGEVVWLQRGPRAVLESKCAATASATRGSSRDVAASTATTGGCLASFAGLHRHRQCAPAPSLATTDSHASSMDTGGPNIMFLCFW